jgi:hypothetical protein
VKFRIVTIDLEVPPRVKVWGLRIAIASIVLVGLSAIAYASVPIVFTAHGALTAGDLNADFAKLDDRIGTLEEGGALYAKQAGHATSADNAATAGAAATGTFAVPGDLNVAGGASVAGTLSVGLHASTNCAYDSTNGFTDCACAANEIAISGGSFGGGSVLDESRNAAVYPAVGSTWRVACRNSAGARTQCLYPNAICARLAP